jgi:hypothetical protein
MMRVKTTEVVDIDVVRLCLRPAVTNWHIVHPPGVILVWRATVEKYCQENADLLIKNPAAVPLCLP